MVDIERFYSEWVARCAEQDRKGRFISSLYYILVFFAFVYLVLGIVSYIVGLC